MEDIKEFLKSIGLGKNEAEIYLDLVRRGLSSVMDISKETKIHRSNVYEALTNLMDKSLVYEVMKDNKKLFYARQPASLLDYLKNKEAELKDVVKRIEAQHSQPTNSPSNLRMAHGKFALREAITSLLEIGEPISVYGVPQKAPEILGPILDTFHRKRIEKKILMRHIYNKGDIDGEDRTHYLNQLPYTEAKHLATKYDSGVSTLVCGSKVLLLMWHGETTVIEIDNDDVAKAYQNYFEILWKAAKPF